MQGPDHGNTEFYLPKAHSTNPDDMTAREVRQELRIARTRLMLASAFVDFMRFAYAALLNHGVDYQTLKAYKDTSLLHDAANLPILRGSDRYLEWLGRVRHDITAAHARRGLRAVFAKPAAPPRTPKKET